MKGEMHYQQAARKWEEQPESSNLLTVPRSDLADIWDSVLSPPESKPRLCRIADPECEACQ